MTITHPRPALAAMAAALLLSACSSASYPTLEKTASPGSIQIQVTNNNWSDMTVYALNGGSRVRLGTVTTGTTTRFRLPRIVNVMTDGLRLEADPLGSRDSFRSPPIMAEPGVTVEWSIENHVALSSYRVTHR